MSKRIDRAAQILNVGLHSDPIKAIVDISEIYDSALTEILKRQACCKCSAELKIIAQNAVVKAVQIGQSVKPKIEQK